MNRNNIYTVNPLYNGSTTQATGDDSVQSGGTTIIYQQGSGTGLTDAQKQKLDGIQEGAEVNQNAYSKVRLNGSDALIIEAKNKTDILNMSGVYPIAIAINGNGGLDFTVSSDQSNTNSVVTQSQLKAAIDQLEKDKYWKVDADGKLYTELDVYSHKEISAYGAGTGGGSTGGAGALYECADVLRDGDKVQGAAVGSILSYNGSHWYAIPQSAITPDLTNYATKSYVTQQINDLIGGAPGTLDTLKEIAEALGNNPNFATTVTEMINNIGLRVDRVEDRVVSLEDMFEWDKSASASDPSLWRIKAKKDLYGVGEISAYGLGETQPSVTTLAGLDDVTITSPANGQTLIYDSATSQWKNGTIIGGGNISLNGTVYKPVNGVITLPNLKPAEPTWFSLSNGNSGNVQVRTTGRTGYYEFWDTGAEWAFLAAKGYKTPGGTSSQFLKADGSVDSNVYLTQSSTDTRYVLKTGDTMGGRLTAPSFRASSIISVGALSDAVVTQRAELHLITPSDNPCDLWMGANNSRRWSITARGSGENYQLGIYNNTRSNWSVIFRDDINDFYAKTKVRSTFLVVPSNIAGGYNEGIRVCNGSNNWSNIQFGAQNAWNGMINGQWVVGKNPANYFQVCMAGTETSNTTRPSKGFSVDTNGYLHTGYISVEINTDNQGNYFYSSDDAFLRRSAWYAALSHLSNNQRILDLTSLDQNKWYPCIIGAPAYGGTPLRITLFNGLRGNKPTWGSHQQGFSLLLDYEVTGSGWGTLGAIAKLNWYFGSYGGETAFGGRQQNTKASAEIIYLRGGGIYYYRTTNGQALTVQPNGYTWSSSSYNYSAPVKTSQDNSPMEKTFDQVYWAPNNLRNTRTIWGQSFNGTQNVSGALSGATTITATGDITTSANIGGRSIYASADLTAAGYTYCNGRLYVDRGRFSITATPTISLAIGNTDTGFHWESDGIISIYCNNSAVGGWQREQFRYGHGYLKEAIGNDYHTLGIMVNGNGTANTIKPGIGFHQPGVYANSLRSDGPGDFRFCVQGGTVGCTVRAANFYANGGFLYSSANGCELKIGSQNGSYVHFTTNPARTLYFDNSLYISGDVVPYTNEGHALGNSGHWWRGIYGKEVYVSSWVRFTGSSGVYWTAYSGGWTMNDATYIRSYGGKSLWIEGSIIANGEVTAYSDIRLKSNIKPLDYKGRLAPKWFIKDNKPSIGFIAQEVQTLYPELVKVNTSTTENYLSLNYGAITAVLSAQVNRVEDEVEALKNRIRQLENEVALLKQKP